jgi:hypothetical protein
MALIVASLQSQRKLAESNPSPRLASSHRVDGRAYGRSIGLARVGLLLFLVCCLPSILFGAELPAKAVPAATKSTDATDAAATAQAEPVADEPDSSTDPIAPVSTVQSLPGAVEPARIKPAVAAPTAQALPVAEKPATSATTVSGDLIIRPVSKPIVGRGGTTAVPALLTTPTPNSQLAGSSESFSWTAGTNVTAYRLYLGTKGAGTENLYDS